MEGKMDFELKNLEMIESTNQYSTSGENRQMQFNQSPNSIILNELHKENEELQNKLKLNYRRLILFESENNKLVEEKNKLFFEMQNYSEQNNILTERNNELESENDSYIGQIKILKEKTLTLEQLNDSQLNEIKRFSKSHLKIQNVVKPYILKLKQQLQVANNQLQHQTQRNEHLEKDNQRIHSKITDLTLKYKFEIDKIYAEKTNLITSYEEQIKHLSQDILSLQSQNEDSYKEISKLKKSVEFKNYFENELIKFKRIHEEDQTKIAHLSQNTAIAETQLIEKAEILAQLQIELSQQTHELSEKNQLLDVTRRQLTKQLDQNVILNERLNRLEKLNNQLSLEMSQTS